MSQPLSTTNNPYTQHVIVKKSKLAAAAKQMTFAVECPTCHRHLFDAFFVGFLEIKCFRCKDDVAVMIQGSQAQAADAADEPPAAAIDTPNEINTQGSNAIYQNGVITPGD